MQGGYYTRNYTYEALLKEFIYINEENEALLKEFPIDKKSELSKLQVLKKDKERVITTLALSPIKEVLQGLSQDKRNEIFSNGEEAFVRNHYFPLIQFLLLEGLIDETYWHYKGYFYEGSLGKNDTIYIKNLLEGKEQGINIEIENPIEVMERLDSQDYQRFNILNRRLFEQLVISQEEDKLLSLTNSVTSNDKLQDLIMILDNLEYKYLNDYVVILFEKNISCIEAILDISEGSNVVLFGNILKSIYTIENADVDKLIVVKKHLENNENILEMISTNEIDAFISNIKKSDVKFSNISESNSEIQLLEQIETIQGYRLDVNNVSFLLKALINQTVEYGDWITFIFNETTLVVMKEYIKNNFVMFMEEYIRSKPNGAEFKNSELELINILKSELDISLKQEYLSCNQVSISNITDIVKMEDNEEIMEFLFKTNKIDFNSNNLKIYWGSIEEYSSEFVSYVNKNAEKINASDVFKECPSICQILIENQNVSDTTFDLMLNYVNNPIDKIDACVFNGLTQKRVLKLISKKLISLNVDNLSEMFNSRYYDAIVMLAEQTGDEEFASVILSSNELIESIDSELLIALVNSKISETTVISIIDALSKQTDPFSDSYLAMSEITYDKVEILKYILDNKFTINDTNFIAQNFLEFPLKEDLMSAMTNKKLFDDLADESLNRQFMEYVLSSNDVLADDKINLIIRRIKLNDNGKDIQAYLQMVEEVKELASVFNRKYPSIEGNKHKLIIAETLSEEKYVSISKNKRLHLLKKK